MIKPVRTQGSVSKWILIKNFRYTLALFGAITVLVGWLPLKPYSQPAPGILVQHEPIQIDPLRESWEQAGYTFKPLASYAITARILAIKPYTNDRSAAIAPFDFALGWQEMSDTQTLENINITQSNRWYYLAWRTSLKNRTTEIGLSTMVLKSANTHILPANPEVERQVKNLQKHQLISLSGYLVEVSAKDGFVWKSSLSRSDTGDGSCEIFWVERVEVLPLNTLFANTAQ